MKAMDTKERCTPWKKPEKAIKKVPTTDTLTQFNYAAALMEGP